MSARIEPHAGIRCPLGTCSRCDALARAERDARCPSRPTRTRRDEVTSFGMLCGFASANLVAALFVASVDGNWLTMLFNLVVCFWLASLIPAAHRAIMEAP